MKKLNIIFFGTPDFSVPSVELLNNHPHVNIKYVISMPDRKAGRGMDLKSPEVITYAKSQKIPYFQTENINSEEEFLKKISKESIDVFIVLAFSQFLREDILKIPSIGSFNIHTSLLPKYRGAAPIQYALLNGEKSTGVSIQKMVKKMDAGDIVLSHSVDIGPNETGGQLYTRLKFQAALSLNNFITCVINKNLRYIVQNEDNVSFAPTLKRSDGFLDFKNQTVQNICNRVSALDPWPGTFCYLNDKRLKIISISKSDIKTLPGVAHTSHSHLIIGCSDGPVRLLRVQLEGKKPCSDIELLNGIRDKIKINPTSSKNK